MEKRDFLTWEAASRDTIDVKRCYIDVAGDVLAGILLSQIVFLHLPARGGRSRLDISRDGYDWIVRERADWWGECRLSPKQYDSAIKILKKDKGLVVTIVGRIQGQTAVHLRLVWDVFLTELARVIESPPRHGNSRLGDSVNSCLSDSVNSEIGNSKNNKNRIPRKEEEKELEEKEKIEDIMPTLTLGELFDNASLEDVIQLTGDEGSRRRFAQLMSIAAANDAMDSWHAAYRATREAMERPGKPLRSPGAYFNKTLADMLRSRKVQVHVPTGTPEERERDRVEVDEFRRVGLPPESGMK